MKVLHHILSAEDIDEVLSYDTDLRKPYMFVDNHVKTQEHLITEN